MRTITNIFFAFGFTCISTAALNLPEDPPDDFFISYEVKGIIAHEATHITDFKFIASASGTAFLEFEGGDGIEFGLDTISIGKLYSVVRASNFFDGENQPQPEYAYDSLSRGVDADEEHISYMVSREVHIIAGGNEKTITYTSYQESDWDFITRAVLDVLDENRPGWRDN